MSVVNVVLVLEGKREDFCCCKLVSFDVLNVRVRPFPNKFHVPLLFLKSFLFYLHLGGRSRERYFLHQVNPRGVGRKV